MGKGIASPRSLKMSAASFGRRPASPWLGETWPSCLGAGTTSSALSSRRRLRPPTEWRLLAGSALAAHPSASRLRCRRGVRLAAGCFGRPAAHTGSIALGITGSTLPPVSGLSRSLGGDCPQAHSASCCYLARLGERSRGAFASSWSCTCRCALASGCVHVS